MKPLSSIIIEASPLEKGEINLIKNMFDIKKVKQDFPIFTTHPDLVYLDSTATSLKPISVLDKEDEYYKEYSANIFRGIYELSEKATIEYEQVREKVAQFIGAKDAREIVFVRNATEAINLVMTSWGMENITADDEVFTTIMEHHANFVPWQQLVQDVGCKLWVVGLRGDGFIDENELLSNINKKTKLAAFTHVSNVLGTINPVKDLSRKIKEKNRNCLVLVDGAQAVPHLSVNVTDLGCDFYVFSSHKMLGPTGVGVLWGRYDLLHEMRPYQFGGEMIQAVYKDRTEFKDAPHKFEAGTPHIAGVIGLGAAIDYLTNLGLSEVRKHEIDLTKFALSQVSQVKDLQIYGPTRASDRGGVVSFTINKVHAHDIAQVLDSKNICIRSGHHCAMPLHIELGISSTARASFYIYNSREDVDKLVEGLEEVRRVFKL